MFYHCKNKSWELEVCGGKYFCVHIIVSASQQIPGFLRTSRTFNLNLQDFPVPNHFPELSRPGNFMEKIPGLSRRHGNPVNAQHHLVQTKTWSGTELPGGPIASPSWDGVAPAAATGITDRDDGSDEPTSKAAHSHTWHHVVHSGIKAPSHIQPLHQQRLQHTSWHNVFNSTLVNSQSPTVIKKKDSNVNKRHQPQYTLCFKDTADLQPGTINIQKFWKSTLWKLTVLLLSVCV